MRILISADAELPVPPRLYGGIERIIASLVESFREKGHIVALVAHPESTVESDAFFPWPAKTSTDPSDSRNNSKALHRAIKNFNPDIVHSFSRLRWLLPLLFSSIPRIMSYQRDPSGRTVAWSRRLHGSKLRFTGCSEHICRTGENRGGGNWVAIPNFIDPESFNFVPQVAEDAPLVFLSRIERIKGVHNAIAIAKGSGRRLIIAGNRVESTEGTRYWNEEIEPHLGSEGIEYVGPVDDQAKNALLGRAAAMVVPIEWEEPFGIVFIEALACGTPVISTRRGSVPEIIKPGSTGWIIESNAEGIAAVKRIPELNRTACRNEVLKRFSVANVATQYLNLYQETLHQ